MSDRLVHVLRRNLISALSGGDLEEAAALLERLKERDRLAKETRGLELEYLVRSHRDDEAIALARQLVELFPASPRVRHWAGRAAYRARAYEEAEAHLRESLRLSPHWRTEWWLGKTLTQGGALDAAEAILAPLADQRPWVAPDLAWLHERRGEAERALRLIEDHLRTHADDDRAREQRHRLKARLAAPEDLVDEVATLSELGEEVPEPAIPEYVETLLRTGRDAEARRFVRDRRDRLRPKTRVSVAWKAHRLQAFDLSFDLFRAELPAHLGNPKYLNALERAARRAGRAAELIEDYARLAERHRPLYGRIRKLERAP